MIQSGVIQVVVSHLRKKRRGQIYNLSRRDSQKERERNVLALDTSFAATDSSIHTYLIVVVVKRDLVLLVKIVQVLRQVTHSQLVPPLAVRMLLLVFFLHLNSTRTRENCGKYNTEYVDTSHTVRRLANRAIPDTSSCPGVTNNSLRIRDGEASSRTDSGSVWYRQPGDW